MQETKQGKAGSMMVVPMRMMGSIVQVKDGGKEEEDVILVDNDLGCNLADKVEFLDCRMC